MKDSIVFRKHKIDKNGACTNKPDFITTKNGCTSDVDFTDRNGWIHPTILSSGRIPRCFRWGLDSMMGRSSSLGSITPQVRFGHRSYHLRICFLFFTWQWQWDTLIGETSGFSTGTWSITAGIPQTRLVNMTSWEIWHCKNETRCFPVQIRHPP